MKKCNCEKDSNGTLQCPVHSFPYADNDGQTHWEGCYRTPHHHNCAVAMVDSLRAKLEQAEARLFALSVVAVKIIEAHKMSTVDWKAMSEMEKILAE